MYLQNYDTEYEPEQLQTSEHILAKMNESRKYRALYAFKSHNVNELSLEPNDILEAYPPFPDLESLEAEPAGGCYLKGRNQRTGDIGYFPGEY